MTDALTATASDLRNLAALVEQTTALTRQLGREDLTQRLEQTRSRLEDPNIRVIVVGQFKQGKSKLVNALINAPACAVDDDLATSIPTSVGYAEQASAALIVREEGPGGPTAKRITISLEELDRRRDDAVAEIPELIEAEVLLPREVLKGGLRVVDSPGVGGLESTRALSTLTALSSAHAVLLVSDASQEYTEPEMQFLRHAMRVCPNVAAVLSKTDVYPEWRAIEQIDRAHLDEVGGIPLFSVSSDLRLLAATQQDGELNDESGFPGLVRHLRRDVIGQAELVQQRAAAHDLLSVADHLALAAQSELSALRNPEQTPEMIARLEDARARAEEFRGRSSRWQVALGDGIADLIADTEHDLRDRLRKVQREAENSIDEGDPGPIWDQIAEWLDQRVATAVSETFVWTDERSKWLCEQVAEEFAVGAIDLPVIDVSRTEGVLDSVEQLRVLEEGRLSSAEKIYIGVRGSYGGVLMVGLASSLIGLGLINPLSLLAGVFVGRRAYREDMSSRLLRRQMEAKNLVRRHIEDVIFQVGKQLKDRLRLVQRTGRDYFGGIAEELHRSLSESVLGAKKAAATFESDREARIRQLQAQLAHIERMREQIPRVLVQTPSTVAVARP
ncbi:dynamin family protein [Microbacterium sp. 179-I 3D4 NHS]|uniref:dynamin family protein n=1 Tax=Microbacterium sp. 179-I 3D4 NHS TaxID=3142381 RepID=UPI0039A3766E